MTIQAPSSLNVEDLARLIESDPMGAPWTMNRLAQALLITVAALEKIASQTDCSIERAHCYGEHDKAECCTTIVAARALRRVRGEKVP